MTTLQEIIKQFRNMPRSKQTEAYELAVAAALFVFSMLAGYYAPDF